jgi:hypothetical protein
VPAIVRGLIAVAGYGIQTFLASAALDVVLINPAAAIATALIAMIPVPWTGVTHRSRAVETV